MKGRDRQEILDYFVSRYGEWVLLKPKQEGLNWIIWLVPPVVLFLGLLWAMNRARTSQTTRTQAEKALARQGLGPRKTLSTTLFERASPEMTNE